MERQHGLITLARSSELLSEKRSNYILETMTLDLHAMGYLSTTLAKQPQKTSMKYSI